MREGRAQTVFTWLDRGFWLLWLGFPVVFGLAIEEALNPHDLLTAQLPDQADCIAALPTFQTIHLLPSVLLWGTFLAETLLFALILGLAHVVVHRCAKGLIFVDEVAVALRRIGVILAVLPVLDLAAGNLFYWVLYLEGDVAAFRMNWQLDVTGLGLGLLMVAMALAMRQAVALREEAALTI